MGHETLECWCKNQHLKEISRRDGKLKRKYKIPLFSLSSKYAKKYLTATKTSKNRNRPSSPSSNSTFTTTRTKP